MASGSAIRVGLQAAKVGRGLEGFTARRREAVELQPCGVEELDAILGGGFPRGSLVEICGTASSGRTSLSLALLAQATERQEACAYVDVSDALDPMSLAAAGVDAARLLWVRCGGVEGRGAPAAEPVWSEPESRVGAASVSTQAPAQSSEKPNMRFAWRHPRDQIRGVETAIPALVRETSSEDVQSSRAEGDFVARCTGEQVEPDRQAPRRGENVRRRFLPQERMRSWEEGQERLAPKKRERDTREERPTFKKRGWSALLKTEAYQQRIKNEAAIKEAWTRRSAKPWKRLEQALKTTDLLLHSGGWGVVVVDLGGISWVEARRIPMHTWFRFRRVVESSPTILLLLGEEPCAKSCASLVLRCQRVGETWRSAVSREKNFDARSNVVTLQGFEVQGEIACSRTQRLEVHTARWQTRTLWNGG